jgi:hypothetical protein
VGLGEKHNKFSLVVGCTFRSVTTKIKYMSGVRSVKKYMDNVKWVRGHNVVGERTPLLKWIISYI